MTPHVLTQLKHMLVPYSILYIIVLIAASLLRVIMWAIHHFLIIHFAFC